MIRSNISAIIHIINEKYALFGFLVIGLLGIFGLYLYMKIYKQ